jgi:CheY-like chemotaxis protein
MQAEERKAYQDLLKPPFSGYLLKPFRRSTIIRQLTAGDEGLIATAVSDLRSISAKTGKKQFINVLLAEDNPVNALLARTMLEKAGAQVAHVTNGREVLKCLENGLKPDLVIMDVEMPGLNGLDTTRAVREREARDGKAGHLPILALTANSRREDHEECLAAGMDGHLSKPFDRQDLDEAIARLVKRPSAA